MNLSHSLTIICFEIFNLLNIKKYKINKKNEKKSSKGSISILVNHIKTLLDKKDFFKPFEKKHSMVININNLFYRMEPSDKELRILASIISALAKNKNKG